LLRFFPSAFALDEMVLSQGYCADGIHHWMAAISFTR
jgi:hypothetical protein